MRSSNVVPGARLTRGSVLSGPRLAATTPGCEAWLEVFGAILKYRVQTRDSDLTRKQDVCGTVRVCMKQVGEELAVRDKLIKCGPAGRYRSCRSRTIS